VLQIHKQPKNIYNYKGKIYIYNEKKTIIEKIFGGKKTIVLLYTVIYTAPKSNFKVILSQQGNRITACKADVLHRR